MSDFNIEFENFINYMLNDVIEVLTKKVQNMQNIEDVSKKTVLKLEK